MRLWLKASDQLLALNRLLTQSLFRQPWSLGLFCSLISPSHLILRLENNKIQWFGRHGLQRAVLLTQVRWISVAGGGIKEIPIEQTGKDDDDQRKCLKIGADEEKKGLIVIDIRTTRID